jgi:uncharacterized protein (DUF2147 family)
MACLRGPVVHLRFIWNQQIAPAKKTGARMIKTLAKCIVATLFAGVILGSDFAAASEAPNATSPIGTWLFQNRRFAIQIDPCGDRLCAKVSWLQAPTDAQGQPRLDSKNPDSNLRSRPVLGLTVLNGLRRVSSRTWDGGDIYNPDDGNHYQASLAMSEDGSLRVRAFLGIPLFGKTLRLVRGELAPLARR